MSIIKMGVLVVGIRGTLGGVTYSAGKSGPYARNWSRGSNVRSALQTTQRTTQTTITQQWKSISAADRADWDIWAADPAQELTNVFGDPYYISGFAWFVKMSTWLNTTARSPITAAPFIPVAAAPPILTFVVSAGAVACEITYAALTFSPAYDCVIFITLGQSTGAISIPSPPRLIGGWQLPAGTSIDITTEIAARFGTPSVGQRAFALIHRQTVEGYRSAPTALSTDVIA